MALCGTVFDIQRFSLDDGPGIRTAVFLKGCPGCCLWCHNPEGIGGNSELLYAKKDCTLCGECVKICPNGCHVIEENTHIFDRENCIVCGRCVSVCPNFALKISGEGMTAEMVIGEVLKDVPFYRQSGGGLTLSGGEPFFQTDFAYEILKGVKENSIHTCVETAGFFPTVALERVLPFIDLFYFDIKETNEELHGNFTCFSLTRVLENLKRINEEGKAVVLRCPVIPFCNDRKEHWEAVGKLANSLSSVKEIHLLPYHSLGLDKYEALGKAYGYQENGKEAHKSAQEAKKLLEKVTEKEANIV